MPSDQEDQAWSHKVATLAIDALIDTMLLEPGCLDQAVTIAAKEILIRLAIGDRPGAEAQAQSGD